MKHPITTPTGTVIDLAPFCGQNDVRSYLNAPFSVQGGTGACDGHALVWVDSNIQAPALSAAAELNIAAVVDRARAEGDQWIPAESIRTSTSKCQVCDGTGRIQVVECEDCDGEGYFHHGQHEYECQECNGYGNKNRTSTGDNCFQCGGSGECGIGRPSSVGNDRWSVSSHLIAKLQALPSCRLCQYSDMPPRGLQFVFDGGCGVVMPMYESALPNNEVSHVVP
jgi:hypothetical protein